MTDKQAKEFVLHLLRGQFCGLVTWCCQPPPGIGYQTHKLSLMRAIQKASDLISSASGRLSQAKEETIIAGQDFVALLSTLPAFEMGLRVVERDQSVITVGKLYDRPIMWDYHVDHKFATLTTGAYSVEMEIVQQ